MLKNLPAMQETQETCVRSLGWEDSLEEEMATHSSIFKSLGSSMDRGAWQPTVCGIVKSWTQLSMLTGYLKLALADCYHRLRNPVGNRVFNHSYF